MKVVILAGGMGSRLSEETQVKPKPMVEIGPYPVLWHIMRHYSHYGLNDFIICLGYKGYVIKEYFANYVCTAPISSSMLEKIASNISAQVAKLEVFSTAPSKFRRDWTWRSRQDSNL